MLIFVLRGLGKTLTMITVLHTVMKNAAMVHEGSALLKTALLIVPVNTLANWEVEIEQWVGKLTPTLLVENVSSRQKNDRPSVVEKWRRHGGVMLVSEAICTHLINHHPELMQPDILVVDEAHTTLKSGGTKVFSSLSLIRTPRRIALTGTPFHLMEYFSLITFVHPSLLKMTKSQFNRQYAEPIMLGMASNAPQDVLDTSARLSRELNKKVSPFIHRRDEALLREELPPMKWVVVCLRSTPVQTHLYTAFKQMKRKEETLKNFLTHYAIQRPIYNHPGCLTIQRVSECVSARVC
jgi:SNF2 family DNA or RNA helicase